MRKLLEEIRKRAEGELDSGTDAESIRIKYIAHFRVGKLHRFDMHEISEGQKVLSP